MIDPLKKILGLTDDAPAQAEAQGDPFAEFPVCEGCGERHPRPEDLDPETVLNMMTGIVLQEAQKVVEKYPGEFPEMEQALEVGSKVAPAVLMKRLQAMLGGQVPTPPAAPGGASYEGPKAAGDAEESGEGGYGMYL